MVNIIPYLFVPQARQVITTYQEVFGAKIRNIERFTPELGAQFGFPPDYDYTNSVMHAEITIHGAKLYLADSTAADRGHGQVEIMLELDTKADLDMIYEKVLAKHYRIKSPLQQMFWGAYYTRFVDEFHISWQLSFTPQK
jgi:uncharacterized glyoxalase superfamily protein PhnB